MVGGGWGYGEGAEGILNWRNSAPSATVSQFGCIQVWRRVSMLGNSKWRKKWGLFQFSIIPHMIEFPKLFNFHFLAFLYVDKPKKGAKSICNTRNSTVYLFWTWLLSTISCRGKVWTATAVVVALVAHAAIWNFRNLADFSRGVIADVFPNRTSETIIHLSATETRIWVYWQRAHFQKIDSLKERVLNS